MARPVSTDQLQESGVRCLTEVGLGVLVAGGLGLSVVLWIAILAVL